MCTSAHPAILGQNTLCKLSTAPNHGIISVIETTIRMVFIATLRRTQFQLCMNLAELKPVDRFDDIELIPCYNMVYALLAKAEALVKGHLWLGGMPSFSRLSCANLFNLVNHISRYYQINRDNYWNLVPDEYIAIKDFSDNISEERFSFPLYIYRSTALNAL